MGNRVTILHLGEGESRQAWKEALADRPWESGTLIKKDGERAVWRATMLGSSVSVKLRPANKLRVKLRTTEYCRAVNAQYSLSRASIVTPAVFVHGVLNTHEVLVHEWIEGSTLLERLIDAPADERARLWTSGGSLVGSLLAGLIFNKDVKPSNVICLSDDGMHLGIVDVGAVRVRSFVPPKRTVRDAARMIAALFLEPAGLGCRADTTEITGAIDASWKPLDPMSVVSRGLTQNAYCEKVMDGVSQILKSHDDATPKINPLDPPAP